MRPTKIKRLAALTLALLALTGCALNTVTYTAPDGTRASWSNTRLSWKTESATGHVTTPGGTTVSFDVKQSSADAATAAAVTEAAVRGALNATRP